MPSSLTVMMVLPKAHTSFSWAPWGSFCHERECQNIFSLFVPIFSLVWEESKWPHVNKNMLTVRQSTKSSGKGKAWRHCSVPFLALLHLAPFTEPRHRHSFFRGSLDFELKPSQSLERFSMDGARLLPPTAWWICLDVALEGCMLSSSIQIIVGPLSLTIIVCVVLSCKIQSLSPKSMKWEHVPERLASHVTRESQDNNCQQTEKSEARCIC